MPQWLFFNWKLHDLHLLRPFQVRDKANKTLWIRARWLLLISIVAVGLYFLLQNNFLNLLAHHAALEKLERDFLNQFYPAYFRSYNWLQDQGNLAQWVAEELGAGQTSEEILEQIAPALKRHQGLQEVQFGSVTQPEQQFRFLLEEADWQEAAAGMNGLLGLHLESWQEQAEGIYWADTQIGEENNLRLFWFYRDELGEGYYFSLGSNFSAHLLTTIKGEQEHTNFMNKGAAVFLALPQGKDGQGEGEGSVSAREHSSLSAQARIYSLTMSEELVQVAPLPYQLASGMAAVQLEDDLGDWRYLFSLEESFLPELLAKEPYFWQVQADYWVKLTPVNTGGAYTILVTIVEKTDVLNNLGVAPWLLLAFLGAVIVLNGLAFIIYYWQYSRRYFFTNQIKEIIKSGESALLEFKSSLRYDWKEKVLNKSLEAAVLKSIAAFNNSDGGVVILGVDDKGKVVGLKDDYKTLKKSDKDGFELHLRGLISQAYGEHFAARRVEIFFPNLAREEVCVVRVRKGRGPIYTTAVDKAGVKAERFYIRMGNSSREIEKPSDIVAYQKERFSWRPKFWGGKK